MHRLLVLVALLALISPLAAPAAGNVAEPLEGCEILDPQAVLTRPVETVTECLPLPQGTSTG